MDINFGCPQKIARRGRYGAYLSDEPQLQQQLVGTLHCHLDVPVTVKIRVLEAGRSATVDYARMLQGAGASVIGVHGRTREQRGKAQGEASWSEIAAVKQAVSVPVLANGGVFSPTDVEASLRATGCDGVMVGEALLDNPALFEGREVGDQQTALAREYIALQTDYPTALASVKQHLFTLLYAHVQVHIDLRERMHKARTLEDMASVVEECDARTVECASRSVFCCAPGDAFTSWYRRHTWEAQRHAQKLANAAPTQSHVEGCADVTADAVASLTLSSASPSQTGARPEESE